jgi:hypothetical protein
MGRTHGVSCPWRGQVGLKPATRKGPRDWGRVCDGMAVARRVLRPAATRPLDTRKNHVDRASNKRAGRGEGRVPLPLGVPDPVDPPGRWGRGLDRGRQQPPYTSGAVPKARLRPRWLATRPDSLAFLPTRRRLGRGRTRVPTAPAEGRPARSPHSGWAEALELEERATSAPE